MKFFESCTVHNLRSRNLLFLHSLKYIICRIDILHTGRNNHFLQDLFQNFWELINVFFEFFKKGLHGDRAPKRCIRRIGVLFSKKPSPQLLPTVCDVYALGVTLFRASQLDEHFVGPLYDTFSSSPVVVFRAGRGLSLSSHYIMVTI